MNITVLAVGKLKEKYWQDAIREYSKRLGKYCRFQIVEVKESLLRRIRRRLTRLARKDRRRARYPSAR